MSDEQISIPAVPIVTIEELYDRYEEYLSLNHPDVDDPYPTISSFVDGVLKQYPHLKVETYCIPGVRDYQVIRGVYLKHNTLAAKRLAARGKKYPYFIETFLYEKHLEAQKTISELEDYANGE